MIYMENIYLCLAAPILVACFCSRGELRRALVFCIIGMTSCLLSAYINIFFAQAFGTSIITATMEIAPLVEEIMKLLPILFYLIVFEPKNKTTIAAMLLVAIGFASFENICYLVEHGTDNLSYLLMRGFGTGAMHIVCGAVVGYGLLFTWERKWLRIVGSFGVLCIAVTFHGLYNLMMSAGNIAQMIAALMPIGSIVLVRIIIATRNRA